MALTNPKAEKPNFEVYAGYESSPLVTQNLIEQIVPINSELTLRWLNRIAGDGLRMSQMVHAGFEICRPDELKMKDGSKIPPMMIKDGKVMFGDIVAAKISKKKYFGSLKYNAEVALASANRMRISDDDVRKVNQEINKNAPNEIRGKVQAYRPTEQELKSKVEEG